MWAFGSALTAISSRAGSGASAHPCAPTITSKARTRLPLRMSVQFQDQPVQIRAHPQDDLADDVNVMSVLRVDRTVAEGAGCQEHFAVALSNVQPHGEATRRQRCDTGL